MSSRTRILVCEDSATYAHGLTRFLQAGDDIEVVGVCATGEEALEAMPHLEPDLVTMDLELPGMSGIRAVKEIMRSHAVPILVLSGHVRRGSRKAAEALAAGALEALPKDDLRLDRPEGLAALELRRKLLRLARADVKASLERSAPPVPPAPPPASSRVDVGVIGICASTGGPRAIETVLAGLPAEFDLPVLVVQHMAVGFIDGLIQWLDRHVSLPVALADDGQLAGPGIWFAPDDAHLLLDPSMRLVLDGETEAGQHRPSADMLLESMASSAGASALGVVLTGMGRDGEAGVRALCRRGGRAIAQDEATSAVFGMPRAAAEAGAETVPLPQIAGALSRLGAARGDA